MNKLEAQYKFHLKYFSHNPELDLHMVIPRFFRLGIKRLVEDAIKYYNYMNDSATAEELRKFLDDLPSFTKFYKNPSKGKGWYIRLIQALFLGQHNRNELNTEYLMQRADEYRKIPPEIKRRVVQYFVGESIKNKNLDIVGEIIKEALPEWEIIILHGGKKGISQYTAEKIVKEKLDDLERENFSNKPVLILCAKMAQRSFTLSETTELYLAYDGGSQAGTDQKISRVLSPNYLSEDNKIGNIFSLSFDPNRDSKIDDSILESALNVSKKDKSLSPDGAVREILKSVDIFSTNENGVSLENDDKFILNSLSKGSVHRAIGVIFNPEGMDPEDMLTLAMGDTEYENIVSQETSKKGKTNGPKPPPNGTDGGDEDDKEGDGDDKSSEEKDILSRTRKAVMTLSKNFDEVFWATNTTTCQDAIDKMISEDSRRIRKWREGFLKEHGIPLDLAKKIILDEERLNPDWIELEHQLTRKEIEKFIKEK